MHKCFQLEIICVCSMRTYSIVVVDLFVCLVTSFHSCHHSQDAQEIYNFVCISCLHKVGPPASLKRLQLNNHSHDSGGVSGVDRVAARPTTSSTFQALSHFDPVSSKGHDCKRCTTAPCLLYKPRDMHSK